MTEDNLFEQWVTGQYDYENPEPGEIRTGILLEINDYEALVDVGFKHDGIVPRRELDRLAEQTLSQLEVGQEIPVRVVNARDQEDRLILSLAPIETEQDWARVQELLESDDVWQGEVTGYNRGGLLVKFGQLQGFVPASHLLSLPKYGLSSEERQDKLGAYVGRKLPLIVIEADQAEERLIFSERLAKEETREQDREAVMESLSEGDVRRGTVRHLTDFGAFVDLGGADGLVHISELAWHHVDHPGELVQVGDEVEVKVLELDYERNRINLSRKRLQPNPWSWVDAAYREGQLVTGTVTKVVQFGAFVSLDIGVDGLLHVSEIAEPVPHDPREFLEQDQELVLRILDIDPSRQRLSLSLKQVEEEEREAYLKKEKQEETIKTN